MERSPRPEPFEVVLAGERIPLTPDNTLITVYRRDPMLDNILVKDRGRRVYDPLMIGVMLSKEFYVVHGWNPDMFETDHAPEGMEDRFVHLSNVSMEKGLSE